MHIGAVQVPSSRVCLMLKNWIKASKAPQFIRPKNWSKAPQFSALRCSILLTSAYVSIRQCYSFWWVCLAVLYTRAKMVKTSWHGIRGKKSCLQREEGLSYLLLPIVGLRRFVAHGGPKNKLGRLAFDQFCLNWHDR